MSWLFAALFSVAANLMVEIGVVLRWSAGIYYCAVKRDAFLCVCESGCVGVVGVFLRRRQKYVIALVLTVICDNNGNNGHLAKGLTTEYI